MQDTALKLHIFKFEKLYKAQFQNMPKTTNIHFENVLLE